MSGLVNHIIGKDKSVFSYLLRRYILKLGTGRMGKKKNNRNLLFAKQQDDMDRTTIPTPQIQCSKEDNSYSKRREGSAKDG